MPTQNADTTDLMRTYLQEIGRVQLLTHEQEIDYGTQVQRMMSLLEAKQALTKKLRREPTAHEWASHVQLSEAELNQTMRHGQRAKRKMVEANLRLVVAIAKKYQKRNMEFLDLIQEGSIGLEKAAEKFDPARGWKFSTYAYWWIRQSITRAISQQARTIRLPVHITEKLNKIKKVQIALTQKLGRSPTPAEIGQELRLEPAQIRKYMQIASQPISLDLRVGDNQDMELQDLLKDDAPSPEEYVSRESLRQDLGDLLAKLTPQQQEVLSLRFGLGDGKELSLAKISERLSLSRESVRTIERLALNHLRRHKGVLEYASNNYTAN